MKKAGIIILLFAVILFGCDSEPVRKSQQFDGISGTNEKLSVAEKDRPANNTKILKSLSEDLDGDTHPEDIALMLLENAQNSQWYDLSLKINATGYAMPEYCTNPVSPDLKIDLQTLELAAQFKFIVLSASFPANGSRTDGVYRANVFRFYDKKITPVWDGTYSHAQSDFQYIINTDRFTLQLPEEKISYTKKFESDSKYSYLMTERKEKEKTEESIPSIFLSVQEIENLGIQDYDNDGFKEIITQNAIFLEDAHIYIGSLYTAYRPENLPGRPEKVFMLDRYGISSRIMKEIIDNGFIRKGSWGPTLSYWIESKYKDYTEKDVEKSLDELAEQKVITMENGVYRLLLK